MKYWGVQNRQFKPEEEALIGSTILTPCEIRREPTEREKELPGSSEGMKVADGLMIHSYNLQKLVAIWYDKETHVFMVCPMEDILSDSYEPP